MRHTLEDIFVAKEDKNKNEVIRLYIELESNIAFFQTRLAQLQALFSTVPTLKKRELLEEVQTTNKLIETMNAYIENLKSNTILGFKTKKLDDNDIAVLRAQVRGIQGLRTMVDETAQTNCNNQDKLSQLIDDAAKMEYDISLTRRWLRRGTSLLGHLVSAAIAIVAIVALMTPGVNIIAAAVMIPTMLTSAAAFLYLRHPVVTSTPIAVGSFQTTVSAAVPSTMGMVAAAGMGISLFRKLRITNPAGEAAARNAATATMNGYSDELRKKISLIDNISVKTFLKTVIDKADTMYNEGIDSWLSETRSSKTTKARLMLRETAKILENDNLSRLTVDTILQHKVGNSEYTFVQLLNAHRNSSTCWKSKTSTMMYLRKHGMNETNSKSLSLNLIANAAK